MTNELITTQIEAANPVSSTRPHKVERAWAAFAATELKRSSHVEPSRLRLLHGSRVLAGVALVIAASGAGFGVAAAVSYLRYAPVTNLGTAHCYSLAQLGNNGTDVGAAGALGSNPQIANALGTCQMLWQDGFLSSGIVGAVRVTGNITLHQVPALVVCTMANGTAGVFPGDATTCQMLGLSEPNPAVVAPSK
jgi:uncharacterized membrane protein